MRISNKQIQLLKYCKKIDDGSVSFLEGEKHEMAEYLVTRNFLRKTNKNPDIYCITEEGKAYLYEFRDMRAQRLLTSVVSFLALIISIIALLEE